jgi:hypothetical protein
MELGAGVGEEEEEGTAWKGPPTPLNRPTGSTVSPAPPDWGPDHLAGDRTVSAICRTTILGASSAPDQTGLAHRQAVRRQVRPPPDRPSNELMTEEFLENCHGISPKWNVTCIQ